MTGLAKSNLKLSSIQDHNIYDDTDKLYDPLRNLLMNPQKAIHHEAESPRAAKCTTLSDPYKRLTRVDAERIKRDIFIPVDKKLVPTSNFEMVKGSKLRVIDANERIIGAPIKQEDMELIKMSELNKESKIVYQFSQIKQFESPRKADLNQFNRNQDNIKSQFFMPSLDNLGTKILSQVKSTGNLKLGSIQEHNTHQKTDKLYQPLRTILTKPQIAMKNHIASPKAASSSFLKNSYQRLTYKDAVTIKNEVLIPTNQELVPTNHLGNVKARKFRVVNATQKVLNKVISQKELDQILAQRPKLQEIVYEFADQTDLLNNTNGNQFKQQQSTKFSNYKESNNFTQISNQQIYNSKNKTMEEYKYNTLSSMNNNGYFDTYYSNKLASQPYNYRRQ